MELSLLILTDVARIFQGVGVTLCQTEGTHQIEAFSPPEYCRLFA